MGTRVFKAVGSVVRFVVVVLLLVGVSADALGAAPPPVGRSNAAAPELTWTRNLEPAVISAASLPAFVGAPIHDLFGYAFAGGSWQQIPFQVDEVNADGVYEPGDGLLDANDELVFMAKDGGSQAGLGEWLNNADARAYTRYEVRVTNPLAPSEKVWAYVYRSATLSPSSQDYVSWDPGSERVMAATYVAGYDSAEHTGLDSLVLNQSGVDAVDRTKLRVYVRCWNAGSPSDDTFTETSSDISWSLIPTVDGRVRVGGGTASASFWSYGSYFEALTFVDLDVSDPACDYITISWLRISLDWRDPVVSGMAPATYFDDNTPGGVAIDGVPENVATTPVNEWMEVSGALGTLVQLQDISIDSGTITNFYAEHGTEWEPAPPTGDGLQFGDAGFYIAQPAGILGFANATFVLPAGQPNVGATYRSYYDNPLQLAFTAQEACFAQGVSIGYTPAPIFQGVQTTFTASVESGQAPFTYSWDFGDGTTAGGNPVTHVYDDAGIYTVTVDIVNACGAVEETRGVLVHDPAQLHQVLVPLGMRAGP